MPTERAVDDTDPPERTPRDTRRPFTRADALAAGISPRMLRGSRFRRIFRDIYIEASVPESEHERVVAALMLHPQAAFASHTTAARHRGVVVPDSSLVHISVFEPNDRRWNPGIKPHVAPAGTQVVVHKDIRVSEPVRMFIELAAVLELVDVVVAGDNMLRVFKMTAAQLCAGLAESRDYWSGAARYAAGFVRDEVDSPMETRLRLLLVLAGLPEPEVNVRIRDERGEVVMRFDLAYRSRRLAVEYEGRQHVEIIGTWERDIGRDESADAMDWRIIKITARGIYVDPADTVFRVWKALCARGPMLPRPTDAWRTHFPGRRLAG